MPISCHGASSFFSSVPGSSFELFSWFSDVLGNSVSKTLSNSCPFYGRHIIRSSGVGEDVFSGSFSSMICTMVTRDTSGLSSSSYMFIKSQRGFGVFSLPDTSIVSG
jgi:hypothetical protein